MLNRLKTSDSYSPSYYDDFPEICSRVSELSVNDLEDPGKIRGLADIKRALTGIIDHTFLKPYAVSSDIERLCKEAVRYQFFSVCVNSSLVGYAKSLLGESAVKVSAAVGFPLGAASQKAKVCEAREAVFDGADEIDMVINIGRLKDGDIEFVYDEISEIVSINRTVKVKVIIENCYLNDEEKVTASYLAKVAGAHYIKTSTGFGTYGARVEDIELMRRAVGPYMGIKAAGGIKDFRTAIRMVVAGATRLGTSSSVSIVGN